LQSGLWSTADSEMRFKGSPAHTFNLPGADLGAVAAGYTTNFAWKTFRLGAGESLVLQDGNASPGAALYTRSLILEGGLVQISAITGNGFNIYYDPAASGNAYLNGGSYTLGGGGSIKPVGQTLISITAIRVLSNSNVHLDCLGVPSQSHSVQASSNLLSWAAIGTATAASDGTFSFTDTNAPAFRLRFYRLALP